MTIVQLFGFRDLFLYRFFFVFSLSQFLSKKLVYSSYPLALLTVMAGFLIIVIAYTLLARREERQMLETFSDK